MSNKKLLINKFTMRDYGICDKDIAFIQYKAKGYRRINCDDKQVISPRGHILSMPHFDLDEMIEAQKNIIETIRVDAVPRNKQVLGLLEGMRVRILEKDKK
jgi:hypothetical protein